MAQFLGFGTGKDGAMPASGTYTSTKAYCSGASGSLNLTPSSTTGFSVGDFVVIHQSRGTGVGAWEINRISSIGGGVLVMNIPLVNTYTTSGVSVAQVVEIKEYLGGTISGSLIAPDWDGSATGGILPIMCNGLLSITGALTANAAGYRAGMAAYNNGDDQYRYNGGQGESYNDATYLADHKQSYAANENGGGAGVGYNERAGGGGGGGGHGSVGGNGEDGIGPDTHGGTGGTVGGSSTFAQFIFGGGGAGGGCGKIPTQAGRGGKGGGAIIIFSKQIVVTGAIQAKGEAGASAATGGGYYDDAGGGGGGAGGALIIKSETANIGTDKIDLRGGAGGLASASRYDGDGGLGGNGRFRVEACTLSGSISSTYYGSYTNVVGGQNWCGITHGIL